MFLLGVTGLVALTEQITIQHSDMFLVKPTERPTDGEEILLCADLSNPALTQ